MGISAALYNGLSGLNAFSTAMSVVSDNVANASTTAYKSNSVRFGDVVNTYMALQSNSVESEGGGTSIMGISTDYAQGNMQTTQYWSDVAVSGEGFFVIKDPTANPADTANDNAENFTRDGSFRLNEAGKLVTLEGLEVQGYAYDKTAGTYASAGSATSILIATPEDYRSFRIDSEGVISGVKTDGTEEIFGKLQLKNFTNKDGLVRQGGNKYITGPDIGSVLDNGDPDQEHLFGKVNDNSLESSNVDIAREMVSMIIYQSNYNANSKSITTGANMIDTTVGLVR